MVVWGAVSEPDRSNNAELVTIGYLPPGDVAIEVRPLNCIASFPLIPTNQYHVPLGFIRTRKPESFPKLLASSGCIAVFATNVQHLSIRLAGTHASRQALCADLHFDIAWH